MKLFHTDPGQDRSSTRHPLRLSFLIVFLSMLMTAVLLGFAQANQTVHAQTTESTVTSTPTNTPIPTRLPTGTATLTPTSETLNMDLFKALIRARILILIRAKILAALTPEATAPPESTATLSHTVAIPMVMNEALITPTVMVAATPTPTAIPPTIPTVAPAPLSPPIVPTPDGALRTAQIPILMYHYLSVPPDNADIYRRDLSVAPDLFAQHLDRLREEGYTTIRLDDLLLHLTEGAPLPARPVILTFDDGYRDNYTNAFPLLKERGMTATFFIVTDFIDLGLPDYLSWEMVREMHAGGMSIQSHGRNHASLKGRDDAYLIWQALGSLETIEHELGERPRFISYPAGQYDENTIRIFQSAHYWAGVTTVQGATHSSEDLFELRRVRIRGATSADELVRLLALDW
ncbi:MAG: polysaccharide deacetylase family protein [Caldilineaceae bacterium]|nr:polysaccharide deacetylase family protein [Caldilineaceae bacterium]